VLVPPTAGEILLAARKHFGLTQEQFASVLGVTLSRLQKWESGTNQPRFTLPELRRLRRVQPEVFEALLSGFFPSTEAVPNRRSSSC